MSCCNPNGLNEMFAGAFVRQEQRAFRRRGPNARQRRLLELLQGPTSILEIGCGIGAVTTTLLSRGAAHGVYVDVSRDYLRVARELAAQADVLARAQFAQGDFVLLADDLPEADAVLLDRVVCCYPAAVVLVARAATRSQRRLLLSYPRPSWLLRGFRVLMNSAMRVLGREYRFFLHDPAQLHAAATRVGHRVVTEERIGVWQVVLLERAEA